VKESHLCPFPLLAFLTCRIMIPISYFNRPSSSLPSADISIINIIHLMPLHVLGFLESMAVLPIYLTSWRSLDWTNERSLILLVNNHPFSPLLTQSVSSHLYFLRSRVSISSRFLTFWLSACPPQSILCSMYTSPGRFLPPIVVAYRSIYNRYIAHPLCDKIYKQQMDQIGQGFWGHVSYDER